MEDKFLSVADMVNLLQISLSKGYELIHSKGFPALRLGRRVIIPYEKLMIWVDENLGIENERWL